MAQTEPVGWRILQELYAALIAIAGDPYWYTLTGTDQVRLGTFPLTTPPRDGTCVALGADGGQTVWGDGTLTGVSRAPEYVIQGWAMAAADTPPARLQAAMRLEQDLIQAIRGAVNTRPSLLGSCYEITLRSDPYDGHQVGLKKSCGYVVLTLSCAAHLESSEVS